MCGKAQPLWLVGLSCINNAIWGDGEMAQWLILAALLEDLISTSRIHFKKKKKAGHIVRSKTISIPPPCSLLQFLPFGPCPIWVSAFFSFIIVCELPNEMKSFLPKLLLIIVFNAAIGSKVVQWVRCCFYWHLGTMKSCVQLILEGGYPPWIQTCLCGCQGDQQ